MMEAARILAGHSLAVAGGGFILLGAAAFEQRLRGRGGFMSPHAYRLRCERNLYQSLFVGLALINLGSWALP